MRFSLGFVKSVHELKVIEFTDESVKSRNLDLDLISDQNLSALFFVDGLDLNQYAETFEREKRYYPIRPISLTTDENSLTLESGLVLLRKAQESWLLGNNLYLIENIFETAIHLKNLLKKDRDTFFEELWFLFRNNLGTSELTFIYNNLEQKGDEKKRLVKTRIDGKRLPSPMNGGTAEDAIFAHYQKEFGNPFQIVEYDASKGEMVATMSVYQSPVLVMAKLYSINEIQKRVMLAIMKALKD